ncbi:MAG TPA: DUF697 domain-containing protein [Arcobacter sp.]|nr:DUF697 domain-containing protein [Arcobacter sp.]
MTQVEENVIEQENLEVNNKERALKANDIIKNHMLVAMGFGTVPVPIVDLVGLTTTQLNMLRKLSNLYGNDFSEEIAKKAILSLLGGGLAVPAAVGLASLVKIIPVIGQTAGAVSLGATSAATTYAVGRVFVKHFESGGDFLSFNSKKAKESFDEELETGKDVAKEAAAKTTRKTSTKA